MKDTIFTIGYTGFDINSFISELKEHDINVLIDVRSSAYSDRYPDYNKLNLEKILKYNGIYYRNYVVEFGARQTNANFFMSDGYLDFDLFSKSEQFQRGVEKIKNSVAQGYRIVFMCAEKNPIQCHRAILVARVFHELGYKIIHLLPDHQQKTQVAIEEELLNMYFPARNQLDLFSPCILSDEEYIKKAYKLQNQKIGYVMEDEI